MAEGKGRDRAATSSPVRTPTTPGTASAADTSIATTRAWASVERTTAASAMWGSGVEVVHEPALAPQEGIILDPQWSIGAAPQLAHHNRTAHPRMQ